MSPNPPSDDRYDAHSRARWVDEPPKPSAAARSDFERDRARVLHSAALRRLAAKTQVVGVGLSDFPRTRLTHSLECAQIGRELAAALGADGDLVDAACLAHDLGHPPYGHNGETALAEIAEPCGGFEGNAQSLRILTRLEVKVLGPDDASAGLNLTRAVLDAATKYPWQRRAGESKFGVYADDLQAFCWMRDGTSADRRCIEAQVMDWADDVAYSVHDLEDGIQAGHVRLGLLDDADECAGVVALAASSYSSATTADLNAALARLTSLPEWQRDYDGSVRSLAAVKAMTSALIARFASSAITATRSRYGDVALVRYEADLVVPADARAECAILKAVADRYVMSRDEAKVRQVQQREQLAELAAVLLAKAPDSLEPWLRDGWSAAADDAGRLRVVVDQVASLTDTSAALWWQRWTQ